MDTNNKNLFSLYPRPSQGQAIKTLAKHSQRRLLPLGDPILVAPRTAVLPLSGEPASREWIAVVYVDGRLQQSCKLPHGSTLSLKDEGVFLTCVGKRPNGDLLVEFDWGKAAPANPNLDGGAA